MKSLSKTLTVVLVASVVILAGVQAGFGGPPHPYPHPHYYPHYDHWHYTAGLYVRPTVVLSYPVTTTAYYAPDVSNPAPLADIRLVNPAKNRVALRFRLDRGETQTLPAGAAIAIPQAAVISFDRGGAAGWANYRLTDGLYRFAANNGAWGLVHGTSPAAGLVAHASNPAPSE